MERTATVTNLMTLAPESASRRSVFGTCGKFTLRYLKAIAGCYVDSCAYNPLWIGAGPLTESHRAEVSQG